MDGHRGGILNMGLDELGREIGDVLKEVEGEVIGWHGYTLASPATEQAALMGFVVAVTMTALMIFTILYMLWVICIVGEKDQTKWKDE
jgi:hypothetical protein